MEDKGYEGVTGIIEINRDGAMVSLLFAAKTMEIAYFNAEVPDGFDNYSPVVWEVVSMDYPIFEWDTPIDLGDGCSDNNHVGPAYDFCLRRISEKTGRSLLEFDEKGDLRLEQPLTLWEAALSVIRLHESVVDMSNSSIIIENKTEEINQKEIDVLVSTPIPEPTASPFLSFNYVFEETPAPSDSEIIIGDIEELPSYSDPTILVGQSVNRDIDVVHDPSIFQDFFDEINP